MDCSYTSLNEVNVKPNPKNARETAVAVAHEGERVLKALQVRGWCAVGRGQAQQDGLP